MKRKDAYLFLISTFILVIAWVALTIFNSANNSTISGNLTTQILPIQPTFDEKTINLLKQRKQVIPETSIQILDEEASTAAAVTPTPSVVPSLPSTTSANKQITPTP